MEDELTRKTKETAEKLFGKGIKVKLPYYLWRDFDPELANDFSRFITGNLYSREAISLPERQLVACVALAALRASEELRLHLNAALNVGVDRGKLVEAFFQLAPYTGMPAVNEALKIYREVLTERGEWPLKKVE